MTGNPHERRTANLYTSGLLLAVILALPVAVRAERLPITTYTTANGLPHDRVKCIVRDSRGFLWFCTPVGLSRFDGERFVNYGVDLGLSHSSINELMEGADGTYWLATNGGGVCRFTAVTPRRAAPDRLFTCLRVGEGLANRVNTVYADRRGRVWAGTDAGLFRLESTRAGAQFAPDTQASPRGNVWAIVEDASADIWVASNRGLARFGADGRTRTYDLAPARSAWSLLADREGRLWIGFEGGLLVVKPLPMSDSEQPAPLWRSLVDHTLSASQGSGTLTMPTVPGEALTIRGTGSVLERPGSLLQTSDGHVWIGSELWSAGTAGVLEYDGRGLRAYTPAHGLGAEPIVSIAEDREGNVWLAGVTGGATRVARAGFVSYDDRDGLGRGRVHALLKGPAGELYGVTDPLRIHRFDGTRFTGLRPNIGSARSDGFFQMPIIDRAGDWWIPTTGGLFRFSRPARFEDLAKARPVSVFDQRHGLPGSDVLTPFEDSRGDLWFGIAGRNVVVRWERRTAQFRTYGDADGLSRAGPPAVFQEDRAGNLWIAFQRGGIARRRQDRFEMFGADARIPRGQIGTLHLDPKGRLWIGSRDAALAYFTPAELSRPSSAELREVELARVDDPDAIRPQFVLYPATLLGGHGVRTIATDATGAMYIGGDQGVYRFDPATERLRHYTPADGLPGADIESTLIDATGRPWFGTWRGIAQLTLPAASAATPPPVLITHFNIRGEPYPIADLGEPAIEGIELAAHQNLIEVGFFALGFDASRPLRYQYRLDGVDADWGTPSAERRVTYASLSPGRYQFLVRAIAADRVTTPATVSFIILRPFWQQPWFITGGLVVALLLAAVIHRTRVSRLVAVERMRTRIATDLHDDIGSGLSQIAVLSEVIRQRHPEDSEIARPLERIATTARELVDSMSELVWAINPRRDSLADLSQRMRRFASDLLPGRGIELTFRAPAGVDEIHLAADVRRHVFLIFKETVTNLARHSGTTRATVDLSVDGGRLLLAVSDDGCGFDLETVDRGQGITSMQSRAKAAGGTLEIDAVPQRGTRLRLQVPLGRSPWRLRRRRVPRV